MSQKMIEDYYSIMMLSWHMALKIILGMNRGNGITRADTLPEEVSYLNSKGHHFPAVDRIFGFCWTFAGKYVMIYEYYLSP